MQDTDSGLTLLVESAARLRLEDLPASAIHHAALVFADTVGVIMGGLRQDEAGRLASSAIWSNGAAEVLSPGLPRRSAEETAFINATAGTFLELDQGVRPTGHPAMHVIPAALAVAQEMHCSGADLVAAIIAGCEVTTRLFEAYQLTYPVHPHGHLGAIGAATAVARLRHMSVGPVAAIAATLPLLTAWEPCYEGATVRNAWAGFAAEIGVRAARLHECGFTGSRSSLALLFGSVVGRPADVGILEQPIDPQQLHFANDYIKLHSACALTHSALDAVLELRPDPADVKSVVVETVSNNMKLDRQAHQNSLSTRFSLPYAVAAAIHHGHTRPGAFVPDARVADLARRVTVHDSPDLEALWPIHSPARVTVHTTTGSRQLQIDNPRGHYLNPATEAELRSKFVMLSWQRAADALYDRLIGIPSFADCATLFAT